MVANLASLRSEAERALRDSERRLRLVVEAAPNAMVMVDRGGKIIMVNAQAERTFGYAREELVGQPVEMLVPERFRGHHPGLRGAFFADPKPRRMGAGRDLYAVKKDGSEFPVEIGLNPIETDEGLMVLSAIVDITQRKAADLALRDSERRLRLVVEAAPNAMVMVDRGGKIIMVNAQAERTFGYAREELVGQPVEMLVPERFRGHHPGLRGAFFADPKPRRMGAGRDLYAVKKDGSEFPVEIGLNPIETDEGLMVLSAIVDITQRKAADLALRNSERRYSILVDGVTDHAIYMIDPNGIVTNWNRGAERIKGYSAEEIVGRNFSCFYTEADRAASVPQRELEIADREGRYETEALRVRKDGSQFWADVVIDALRDEDGRLIGFAKITRDITERVRAARALEEARLKVLQEELARANRLMQMGVLTASIAHEVNQPLAAVVASAGAALRWLEAKPADLESARQSLKRIVREGERAGGVIGRIRALVRNAPTRRDRLNINEVILEATAIAQSDLDKHGVRLRSGLACGLPAVLADRVQMQQAVLNLIGNAIEAMSGADGGTRELVLISGEDDAANVFVEVRIPPGTDPASVDRLFELFFTTKSEGMGMGLVISRTIVQSHGGQLWAEANQPRGAVFRFTLPVAHEPAPDLESPPS